MTREILAQQITLALQRLEELWQRAESLPKAQGERWRPAKEYPEAHQELLMESLEELSNSLEELHVVSEELRQQNEELTESRFALESSRQYYKELFDFAPDGYLVTTKEGAILEANQMAAQLLDVSQQRLVGKPLVVFIAAEQRGDFYCKLSQLQRSESIKNWLVPIQPRQGACFTASLTVAPVKNPQSQVVSLRWRLLDLTSIPEGVGEAGEMGNSGPLEGIRGKGGGTTRILNTDIQINKDNLNSVYPCHPCHTDGGNSSTLSLGEGTNLHPLTTSSSSTQSQSDRQTALQEQYLFQGLFESAATGIPGLATPSPQMAVAAEQAGRMLNEILSASPDCISIRDRTGKYIYVNQTAAQVAGLAQSDFIGKTCQQLGFPAEIMERFDAQLETVFTTGQPLTDETSFPTVDGVREYEYTIHPIGDINGKPQAVIVTVKDITKYKQATATISTALAKEKEISALKSQSAFVVSQELRNILHNVLTYAELIGIDSKQGTNEKKVNYFQRIQQNIKRINQLLDDLLWIGKTETTELKLNLALLDLTKFCRELTEELQQGAGREHRLTFVSQGLCSSVCMDAKLLRHILMNILVNAIKYSAKGSEVKLDVVCQEKQAIFRIQDSGIGISQKDQELLFKAFHRGSNVGTIPGKGLGLMIVRKCVDLQGGEILVESEESVGTTFTITLPLNLRQVRSRRLEG
jgi:PAS domain S-box-containing protein